jgi:hypothetical protein
MLNPGRDAGGGAVPWEGDRFTPATAQPEVAKRDELAQDRERHHEAWRFFRAAPPYCIEFDDEEAAMLCQKVYEYWPNQEPEEATWRVISRHQNLEEAERRMRLIIGGPFMPRAAWSAKPPGASPAGACRPTTTNSCARRFGLFIQTQAVTHAPRYQTAPKGVGNCPSSARGQSCACCTTTSPAPKAADARCAETLAAITSGEAAATRFFCVIVSSATSTNAK